MFIRLFITSLVLVLLSGCMSLDDDRFACPGSESGVNCMSAIDVYELTNNPRRAAEAREENKIKKKIADGELDEDALIRRTVRVDAIPTETAPVVAPLTQPKPILMPAEVVRVWIAPWVDEKQDLHMASYIFTEVTPRRWSFGEKEVKDSKIASPFITN